MEKGVIGMHNHSNFSDADCSTIQLIAKAFMEGILGLCLTDHDCIDGLRDFEKISKVFEIETIPGIEVSSIHEGAYIHILGYGIDHEDKSNILTSYLLRNWQSYWKMERHILESFTSNNLRSSPTIEEIRIGTGRQGPCTFSFPIYVYAEQKLGMRANELKKDLFGNRELYDTLSMLSPTEAVECIHAAGGKAVWAHPGLFSKYRAYLLNPSKIKDEFMKLFFLLLEAGLDGIEAHYPCHHPKQIECFVELAKSHGLWTTAGTDYHGSWKKIRDIGMPGYSLREFLEFKKFCCS